MNPPVYFKRHYIQYQILWSGILFDGSRLRRAEMITTNRSGNPRPERITSTKLSRCSMAVGRYLKWEVVYWWEIVGSLWRWARRTREDHCSRAQGVPHL